MAAMSCGAYLFLLTVGFFLLMGGVLQAQETSAEEEEAAKKHFAKGVEFFKAGDTEAALAEFLESYRIRPNWALQYNIAICYRATKRYAKSLKAFQEYLEKGGEKIPTERRREVEEYIRELQPKVGRIKLCCGLGQVEVVIDDVEKIEVLEGQEIVLDPGLRKITVFKAGFKPLVREVVVVRGKTKKLTIEMEAEKVRPKEKEEREKEKKEKRRRDPTWLAIWLGIGGAFAAGSAATGAMVLVRKGEMEEAAERCLSTAAREYCPEAYALQDEAKKWKIASNALLAGAVASAGVGLFLYLFGPEVVKKKKTQASVLTAPGSMGLSVSFDW